MLELTILNLTLEFLHLQLEIQSEKSISNRYYFDYNATSPLSNKIIDFIKSGDFLFGNPSSLHQTGKKARKFINETNQFLFDTFSLKKNSFNLFFHSGATEGINTFFKGIALLKFKEKKSVSFFFSTVDHASVIELQKDLIALGHNVSFFGVNHDGQFDSADLIKKIKSECELGRESYINFTYINNETGVVWPLELAEKIKAETNAIVHVDAVQLIGKVENWNKLSDSLDAFTFSGHKFGAMKGVGFSFIKKEVLFSPLLTGGSQQNGLRSGTENAFAVYSIKLALEEMIERFNPKELALARQIIESRLQSVLSGKGEIVGINAVARNLNTIFVVIHGQKAEVLSAKFDMEGVDLSTGSACSSGIIKENRILMNMGYSFDDSRSSLRFSFSPLLNQNEAKLYADKIEKILRSLI